MAFYFSISFFISPPCRHACAPGWFLLQRHHHALIHTGTRYLGIQLQPQLLRFAPSPATRAYLRTPLPIRGTGVAQPAVWEHCTWFPVIHVPLARSCYRSTMLGCFPAVMSLKCQHQQAIGAASHI
ncbi:hypothetical protein BDV19DRAFT_74529 [Aspergillus venezuelensis]